jgi:hypothetical protein
MSNDKSLKAMGLHSENCAEFPGETRALLETLDLKDVQLRRLPIDPYISYFVR